MSCIWSRCILFCCLFTGLSAVSPANTLGQTRTDGAYRLTHPEKNESNQNPCFSPDGSFIVFTRFSQGYNLGPAHLYRLDLAPGSEPVQLTTGDNDDVNVPYGCFQRSSNRIVFASDREDANDFWTLDPQGPALSTPQRITRHGELPVWIEPVYSPAGDWVAFESDNESGTEEEQRASIYKVNPSTHELVQLTNFLGESDDRLPSWSPDGTRILYQHRDPSKPESLDTWEAWTIDANGGTPVNISAKVITSRPGPDTDLSWMPDGRYILSSTNPNNTEHPNIYLLPVSGGPLLRATASSEREDGAPCASPDGRYIAFESHRTADEDSSADIWIIRSPDLPGTGTNKLSLGGIEFLLLREK